MRNWKFWVVLLLVAGAPAAGRASVGLLLEQPIGSMGKISASGHAAIYLSRVCAASPTRLRRCAPGESGVVISRCHGADRFDWTAVPLVPYLYAVGRVEEIPARMDATTEERLRARYREQHLQAVVPPGQTAHGHWTQLIGAAYDRRTYVFELNTTPAQDDRLIALLNGRPDTERFDLFFRNCADFAANVLNFYYPHAVHRSFTADLGMLTPKQTAKSLVSYAHRQGIPLRIFAIPQVPGTIRRSGAAYGVTEALFKKRQYVIPLAIFEPYAAIAMAGTYLARGRFNPERDAILLPRDRQVSVLTGNTVPRNTSVPQAAQLEDAAAPGPTPAEIVTR